MKATIKLLADPVHFHPSQTWLGGSTNQFQELVFEHLKTRPDYIDNGNYWRIHQSDGINPNRETIIPAGRVLLIEVQL